MNSPSREKEWDLHERMLSKDSTVSVDIVLTFMEPLVQALERNPGCSHEHAYDSVIDALFIYFRHPDRYDERRASLGTYLAQIARRKAQDRHRSAVASARRNKEFGSIVELLPAPPNMSVETQVEVKLLVEKIERAGLSERDLACLRLIVMESRSTNMMAEVLGLTHLPQAEMRRAVKRHYDRLMKMLKRLCEEDPDDES
ncbi:RNA polymerase sigma factor [Corallococcus terminator]|uniref:Sigma-70 family RNA polymerase sigma factor n=1 Tax=Corallococcus terminator TaxID=2316733 RepID=A0A3A8J7V0_9BACT|nr:sigma-70 family RNA polymerase sigma factor [Corallococcus terminator]RKG90926.1 sigma-70 family RNA polymerase sigma factor [Corallococcus terminator]